MTILFVDIDGVLNTRNHLRRQAKNGKKPSRFDWCPAAVNNLRRLCEMVNGHIVVSSSWRHEHTLEELREIFRNNGLDEERVIGVTPSTAEQTGSENYCRGHEIAAWLREHPSESYAILDDDAAMLPHQEERLIKTDIETGFAELDAFLDAINVLRER